MICPLVMCCICGCGRPTCVILSAREENWEEREDLEMPPPSPSPPSPLFQNSTRSSAIAPSALRHSRSLASFPSKHCGFGWGDVCEWYLQRERSFIVNVQRLWVIWGQCCLRVAASPCLPNSPITQLSPYLTQNPCTETKRLWDSVTADVCGFGEKISQSDQIGYVLSTNFSPNPHRRLRSHCPTGPQPSDFPHNDNEWRL